MVGSEVELLSSPVAGTLHATLLQPVGCNVLTPFTITVTTGVILGACRSRANCKNNYKTHFLLNTALKEMHNEN